MLILIHIHLYTGNAFIPVIDTLALPCTLYTPKINGPGIVSILYDNNKNSITFTFDSVIQIGYIQPTAITIQLINTPEPVYYTLTSNTNVINVYNILYTLITFVLLVNV